MLRKELFLSIQDYHDVVTWGGGELNEESFLVHTLTPAMHLEGSQRQRVWLW